MKASIFLLLFGEGKNWGKENDGVVGLVNYRGGGRGIRQQHMHMCMVPTNYYLILPSERLYVQPKFQPSTDTRPCPIIIIN